MLFAYQQKTYQIPTEIVQDALMQQEITDREFVEQRMKQFTGIAEDCMTEFEFEIRTMEALTIGDMGKLYSDLICSAFEFIRTNYDINEWVTGITPSTMVHHLHGVAGQEFDVDQRKIVRCEDCRIKSMEYMEDVRRAKEINKRDSVPIGDDLAFMLRFALREGGVDLNSLGDDNQPEFRLFMKNDVGETVEMSRDEIAVIIATEQKTLSTPTHSVPRWLN